MFLSGSKLWDRVKWDRVKWDRVKWDRVKQEAALASICQLAWMSRSLGGGTFVRRKSTLCLMATMLPMQAVHAQSPSQLEMYEQGKSAGGALAGLVALLIIYAAMRWIGRRAGHSRRWPVIATIMIGLAMYGCSYVNTKVAQVRQARAPVPVKSPPTAETYLKRLDWLVTIAPQPASAMVCIATPLHDGHADAADPGMRFVYQQGRADMVISYRPAGPFPEDFHDVKASFLSGDAVVGGLNWNVSKRPGGDNPAFGLRISNDLLPTFERYFRGAQSVRFSIAGIQRDLITLNGPGAVIDRFKRCVEVVNRASPESAAGVQATRSNSAADLQLGLCSKFSQDYPSGPDLPTFARAKDLHAFTEELLRGRNIPVTPHNLGILIGAVVPHCKLLPDFPLSLALQWVNEQVDTMHAYSD